MAAIGYLVLRSAFALAGQIAPRLAGRVAFELFCRTSNPLRVSSREAAALRDATSFMAQARHHWIPSGKGCVVVHEFRGASIGKTPTVLVLHGWGSRTQHMRTIVEDMRREGFRVICLDLPGHGMSPGRRLNIALAVAAVRVTADWFGPFHTVVGHSFGGAVAVNAVAGSVRGIAPVAADRLVLVSSPSSMPAIFEDFGRFLGLAAKTQIALAGQVERVAGNPLEDFVAADQLRVLGIPTLAIHAPEDKEVPFEEARRLEAAGPHVTLMRAPGRGHRRILRDSEIAAAIAGFAVGEAGEVARQIA